MRHHQQLDCPVPERQPFPQFLVDDLGAGSSVYEDIDISLYYQGRISLSDVQEINMELPVRALFPCGTGKDSDHHDRQHHPFL
jgi:hypothetical protein